MRSVPNARALAVREQRPDDAAKLESMGFDYRVRGGKDTRIFVAEENGQIIAAGCGIAPIAGDTAMLGRIEVLQPLHADRGAFVEVLAALVERAIEMGFKLGEAHVPLKHRLVIQFLREHFGLEPKPSMLGSNLCRYRVNLKDFLRRLQAA